MENKRMCVWQKRGFSKLHRKYLKWVLERRGEGGDKKKLEGASNCFETLYWRWMSRDITGEKLNGEQTWRKKERQRERERMCLNGLATDVFPLNEGNCISLLLNRHDEWGRSCFWQTLCYKSYRDMCVRVRSTYVFHKDDFHIKWEKKNKPYKIKNWFFFSLSFTHKMYSLFFRFLSILYICICYFVTWGWGKTHWRASIKKSK